MMKRGAQYLLRFDDLCPTMSRTGWRRFVPLIQEFHLRPILAVVPENCDPALEVEDPDAAFWPQMRAMESAGAAIGLHGYRHLCESYGRGMIPLYTASEFAGVAFEDQRARIHSGLRILRGHGLQPRIWVAPRHGFDSETLRALREEGIKVLSDGFARVPFLRDGLLWIPQQLWAPVEKNAGMWTICVHANTAPEDLVEQLRRFLGRHAAEFTSIDRVMAEFPHEPLSASEWVYERWALWRMRVSRLRRHVLR